MVNLCIQNLPKKDPPFPDETYCLVSDLSISVSYRRSIKKNKPFSWKEAGLKRKMSEIWKNILTRTDVGNRHKTKCYDCRAQKGLR